MPDYKYVAFNSKGRQVSGVYSAKSRDEVADHLHTQGLIVVTINDDIAASLRKAANIQIGGLPIKDKVIFAKQMSIMLSAGVPLIQALKILVNQQKSDFLKEKLQAVFAAVESGTKLSAAFAKDKLFFNDIQLSLLEAGEKSGNLNVIMEQIAVDLEQSKNLRGKIRGAMIYPAVIFFVLIIVIFVVLVFMVPSVKDLYQQLGKGELPWVTQVLVDTSNFIVSPVGLITIPLIAGGGFFGFRYYYSTEQGRKLVDTKMLKLPIFGDLMNKIQVTQFSRVLAMLLQSGIPIIEALKIVANATSNAAYKEVILHTADEVTKGSPISVPLATNTVFPQIYLNILATGEDTGKFDQVLKQMADYYAAEVDEITNNLTKLMEPLILLIVGGVVGFIAIAVYLPIYSLSA